MPENKLKSNATPKAAAKVALKPEPKPKGESKPEPKGVVKQGAVKPGW